VQGDKVDAFGRAQNEPDQLRYLLARRQVQLETTQLLIFQLIVVIAIPASLAVLSFYWPDWKLETSLIALVIALADIVVIDRLQKVRLAQSAKLQEAFDCRVFGLDWNQFIAGPLPTKDFIDAKAVAYAGRRRADTVTGWYPERLSSLSADVGRIAAQTLNMLYDEWLRTHYRILIGLTATLCLMLLSLLAMIEGVSLTTLLLGVLVPTTPLINWCTREVFRQHDALKRLRTTRALNQALWEKALDRSLPAAQAQAAARHTQDVSYIRRSTSPAIFEHLYWIRRDGLEFRMLARADVMIQAAESAVARDR
jgi:hypothetical protein